MDRERQRASSWLGSEEAGGDALHAKIGAVIKRIDGWERLPVPEGRGLFESLVKVPKMSEGGHSLERYLWGAAFLGADHLQYPENVILAAKDLVDQALNDNIIYSEVRCATTGYSAGGMTSAAATNLLCRSFDLAAAIRASGPDGQWVRFNVLLGAKRHKPEEQARELISLLAGYLQAETTELSDIVQDPSVPGWWKPCRVIGFDLSGKEAVPAEKFVGCIEPLFKNCAAITIHAGEAASAESIWQAVYRLGARRIGHGLRLREHDRLMRYCATEGICLELCPISNSLTNDFEESVSRDGYVGNLRRQYPLRYYLDRGLDVCINTDNRFLHDEGTLTAEYIKAARMVGGLTRWELLKIVKAGFKHAFLPDDEIERMLHRVDEEVFSIAAGADEESYGVAT
jgi:adenosine deaminase